MVPRSSLRARSKLVVGIVAGFVGLGACGGGLEPGRAQPGIQGVFFLQTISGQLLPYELPLGINLTVMILGRLEFVSRDRVLDVRVSNVHVSKTNIDLPVTTDTQAYSYQRRGDTILLLHAAFDTVAAYSDTAVSAGDSILTVRVLQRIPDSTGSSFVYRNWVYTRTP
jgi:hypothetical protein